MYNGRLSIDSALLLVNTSARGLCTLYDCCQDFNHAINRTNFTICDEYRMTNHVWAHDFYGLPSWLQITEMCTQHRDMPSANRKLVWFVVRQTKQVICWLKKMYQLYWAVCSVSRVRIRFAPCMLGLRGRVLGCLLSIMWIIAYPYCSADGMNAFLQF